MNHTNRSHRIVSAPVVPGSATLRDAFGPGYQAPVVFDQHARMVLAPPTTWIDVALLRAFHVISRVRVVPQSRPSLLQGGVVAHELEPSMVGRHAA